MNYANQVIETLLNDISEMTEYSWLFSANPQSDFTRTRKLDFPSLLHLCICMEGGTLKHELLKYFAYDEHTISNSSFSFTRNPKDPDSYFAPNGKTTNGYNQIHVAALFDILSKRYSDAVIQPIRAKDVNTYRLLGKALPETAEFDITAHAVIEKKGRKHEYQVNYTVAFHACHYFIRLHNGETPPNINGLIAQNILPIRPDRNFARQHRFRVPATFTYRFS